MDPRRRERLEAFAAWVAAHVRGDEKGEAQIFLDHLFRAFGHDGAPEAGAELEARIKKAGGRGTSFADLIWKPVVLIEMKKRGEDLARHYRQAFDYWTRLVPGRPRYVVLCNFDEFWVYDFETQMDSPVDTVRVEQLPARWGPLAFLFPKPEPPTFGNDQVAVTLKAADHLAECFNALVRRGVEYRRAGCACRLVRRCPGSAVTADPTELRSSRRSEKRRQGRGGAKLATEVTNHLSPRTSRHLAVEFRELRRP